MFDCTGNEILSELLYHLGLQDRIDEILTHCKVRTYMMPYITCQFMPRQKGDCPAVIPESCKNLALMGQYTKCEDVVFTVETSIRTTMIAVYGLLKLDKSIIDIRVIDSMLTGGSIDSASLPPIDQR